MAFWGVEVKPGKPFHHPPSDASGKRLHVSQATLGIGTATTRSVVQCNVGESTPVLLCTLRPDTTESSQLNLEFEESDEVVFSVLGPLSVHLTGYYVQSLGNEMEPHGEYIANTDHELSVDSGNEDDEYEDSFINDGDPGIIPSSPDSGDEGNVKCGRKRLKKKIQLIDSSSEEQRIAKALKPLDNNSEDNLSISLLLFKHKHEEKETRIASETNMLSCKHEEEEEVNKSETSKMEQKELGEVKGTVNKDETTKLEQMEVGEEIVPAVSKMEQKELGEVKETVNKDETTKLEQMEVGEEIVSAVDDVELKSCLTKSKDEAKLKEEMVSEVVKPSELEVQDCSFYEIAMGLSAPSIKQEKTNEQTENVKKSRKRKKHARLEAKGAIIERAENDREHKQDGVKVANLEQPMFNEENEKQADDESGSVSMSEKKKRKKKRRNRSNQEKAEAILE